MEIGAWIGREVPIDEAVVRQTDTDAHISRVYSKGHTAESIRLWIASGVQARDLMPHRPEVCYTGNGWMVVEKRVVDISLDNFQVACNVFLFSRGSFNKEKTLVLYYYLVDGEYCHDVSLLRSKAWRGSGTVGYVAQVQVVVPVGAMRAPEEARKVGSEFVRESAGLIAGLFGEGIKNEDGKVGR